jgi:hypothetical protein
MREELFAELQLAEASEDARETAAAARRGTETFAAGVLIKWLRIS